MTKKYLLLLGFALILSSAVSAVMADTAIYTDEIGRMHFLGKGPAAAARASQQIDDFDSPASEFKDIIYKTEEQTSESKAEEAPSEVKVQEVKEAGEFKDIEEVPALKDKKRVKKGAKGSFNAEKGAMDASNPYVYGGTNLETKFNSDSAIYADESAKLNFFGKPKKIRK